MLTLTFPGNQSELRIFIGNFSTQMLWYNSFLSLTVQTFTQPVNSKTHRMCYFLRFHIYGAFPVMLKKMTSFLYTYCSCGIVPRSDSAYFFCSSFLFTFSLFFLNGQSDLLLPEALTLMTFQCLQGDNQTE